MANINSESNLPQEITGAGAENQQLQAQGTQVAQDLQQQASIAPSSVLTAQQVMEVMAQNRIKPSFGAYHYSFNTGGLFRTGPVMVADFKKEDDGRKIVVYNQKQYKFWFVRFDYLPGSEVDYRTGEPVALPASFECFVDIQHAHLVKQGFNKGFLVMARNSDVAAYDLITPEDAEGLLEYLGLTADQLPIPTVVQKDASGLSREEARAARRDADDIKNGNAHYVRARGRTTEVAEILDIAGASAETRTALAGATEAEAKATEATAKAVVAEANAVEATGGSFRARLLARRR